MRFHHLVLPFAVLGTFLGTFAAALPAWAQAQEGRIVQARGDVKIDSGAGPVAALEDAKFKAATLRTGADGQVQIVMSDGTLIALGADSEIAMTAQAANTVALHSGGLRIDAVRAPQGWHVELGDRSILTNGFLKLQPCAAGCALPPGLYGRIVQGEAVLEYQGGRSVLRNRSFVWVSATARPDILATEPALLDGTGTSSQAEAVRARADIAELLRTGLEAFRDGNDELARAQLEKVREQAPGDTIVSYYLGLIALRRQDNASALRWLQQYANEDPEGAGAHDVPKTLTLLSSNQLQIDVANALAHEKEVTSAPPEPNSIAVNTFVDRGDPAYRAMAKGVAAMIIADLSKVPGLVVLEREKVQLLVNEMKLGDAGLANPATAVRSGRLMRAEKVIVGNLEVQ